MNWNVLSKGSLPTVVLVLGSLRDRRLFVPGRSSPCIARSGEIGSIESSAGCLPDVSQKDRPVRLRRQHFRALKPQRLGTTTTSTSIPPLKGWAPGVFAIWHNYITECGRAIEPSIKRACWGTVHQPGARPNSSAPPFSGLRQGTREQPKPGPHWRLSANAAPYCSNVTMGPTTDEGPSFVMVPG